jgi:hypothetical protein
MKNDKQLERLVELIESTRYWGSGTSEEIADYILANGVIVPPCKVGDKVYWLDNGKIKSDEIFEISIHSDGILVHTGIQFCLEQVFLTKEEAEAKMKEGVQG